MSDPNTETPVPSDWAEINRIIDDFVDDYEFRGDADYTPNDNEKVLIHDAIAGLLEDDDFVREFVRLSTTPTPDE